MDKLKEKIKAQRKLVNENRKKFKKADWAYKQSTKYGTDIQKTKCKDRLRRSKDRYLRSVVILQRLKSEEKNARKETRKAFIKKCTPKKAWTITTACIAVVGMAVGYTILKIREDDNSSSEPMSDSF